MLALAICLTAFGLPPWHEKADPVDKKEEKDHAVVVIPNEKKDTAIGVVPKEKKDDNVAVIPRPQTDPRVLTVSQKPEDGGEFRTINEALEQVEPGKIIRVLDDAVYAEQIKINREQHRGLVLEAAAGKKPTLRVPKDRQFVPPHSYGVGIIGVAQVTLRGFRIDAARVLDQVLIAGASPGTVLERLDFEGDQTGMSMEIAEMQSFPEDSPICIQNCRLRNPFGGGISVLARKETEVLLDQPQVCANIVIRNNDFVDMRFEALRLAGAAPASPARGQSNLGVRRRHRPDRVLAWSRKRAGRQQYHASQQTVASCLGRKKCRTHMQEHSVPEQPRADASAKRRSFFLRPQAAESTRMTRNRATSPGC